MVDHAYTNSRFMKDLGLYFTVYLLTHSLTLACTSTCLKFTSSAFNYQDRLAERLWNALLLNMKRAVDDLYYALDMDFHNDAAAEAHRMSQVAAHDFQKLIERQAIQQQDSPKTLSWEVRRTSPLKKSAIVETVESVKGGTDNERGSERGSARTWAQRLRVSVPERGARSRGGGRGKKQPHIVAPSTTNTTNTSVRKTSYGKDERRAKDRESPPDVEAVDVDAGGNTRQSRVKSHLWGDRVDEESESSPPSMSPTRIRELHARLSSPERKKKSAQEIKRDIVEKEARARLFQEEQSKRRLAKSSRAADKHRSVTERVTSKQERRQAELDARLTSAEAKKEAHLAEVRGRASSHNSKAKELVHEQAWIQGMNAESKREDINHRMNEAEQRRQERLNEARKKSEDQLLKEEAATERRKAIEAKTRPVSHHRKSSGKAESPRDGTGGGAGGSSAGTGGGTAGGPATPRATSTGTDRPRSTGSGMKRSGVKKLCTLCNVVFSEEYTQVHLGGKRHAGNLETKDGADSVSPEAYITNMPTTADTPRSAGQAKDKREKMKIKAKKLRQRLAAKANDYADPAPFEGTSNKNKIQRILRTLQSDLVARKLGQADKHMGDLNRILNTKEASRDADMNLTRQLGGIKTMVQICSHYDCPYPANVVTASLKLLESLCAQSYNVEYMLLTNQLVPLVALLVKLLDIDSEDLKTDERVKGGKTFAHPSLPPLLSLLTLQLRHPAQTRDRQTKDDFMGYLVVTGAVEKLRMRLGSLYLRQEPLAWATLSSNDLVFAIKTVAFLEALTSFPEFHLKTSPVYKTHQFSTTSFNPILTSLRETGFAGVISLMSSMLLGDGSTFQKKSDAEVPKTILEEIITPSFRLLNNVALLDLKSFQSTLGSSEYQLELYHIIAYIIQYCNERSGQQATIDLLHEVLLFIGYYMLQNETTQQILEWGNAPTLLQMLCGLPFEYFSDARYKEFLFPTLICGCYQNSRAKEIMQTEMSTELVVGYLKDKRTAIALAKAVAEAEKGPPKDDKNAPRLEMSVIPTSPPNSEPATHDARRTGDTTSRGSHSSSHFAQLPTRFHLASRFPTTLLETAQEFFAAQVPKAE